MPFAQAAVRERARPGLGADLPACRSAVRRPAIAGQAPRAAWPRLALVARAPQAAWPHSALVVQARSAASPPPASAVRGKWGERSRAAPDAPEVASHAPAAVRALPVLSAAPVRWVRRGAVALREAAPRDAAAAELARAVPDEGAAAPAAAVARAEGAAAADAGPALREPTAYGLAAVRADRAYALLVSPSRRRQEHSAPGQRRFG